MNNLLYQLKNIYDYVLDIDNCLRLVVKMVKISLCMLAMTITSKLYMYIYYESVSLAVPFYIVYVPLEISMPFYLNIYLIIILIYCLLIKKYLGNKKYRILSFFLVVLVFMMFSFYDATFFGNVLFILFFLWIIHCIKLFFEFEEYNHPPNPPYYY